ncbi:MAG: hypothetical protein IT320_14335 [Anaerolineae bacterium]|nr:hypothetical protein [Anaerolineae bacterium]
MTTASDVIVRHDDRVRLMSAVFALSSVIDEAHAQRPHSAHAHARATRKRLAGFKEHPAVTSLETLIQETAPIDAIFGYALRLNTTNWTMEHSPRWAPPEWDQQLRDFQEITGLAQWWASEDAAWETSLSQARHMFTHLDLRQFLAPFVDTSDAKFTLLPNILYPAEHEIGVRVGNEFTCIVPPRPAWGDSPPWPFDEDPVHIYRAAIGQYIRLMMQDYLAHNQAQVDEASLIELPVSDSLREQSPNWTDQFLALFVSGVVAIFLEDRINPAEAKAYTLMESKVYGMAMLPGVVSVLRRYLGDKEAGKYGSFADFLPIFPKQLRVAKRIYSL